MPRVRRPSIRLWIVTVTAAVISSSVVVLASKSVLGPRRELQPPTTARVEPALIDTQRTITKPHGFALTVGSNPAGEQCLVIDGRARACFTRTEILKGDALDVLTRCPATGAGRRVIAGFAPPHAVLVTVRFSEGVPVTSRVVKQTYAIETAISRGKFGHPLVISWQRADMVTRSVRYPIASADDAGCNSPTAQQ